VSVSNLKGTTSAVGLVIFVLMSMRCRNGVVFCYLVFVSNLEGTTSAVDVFVLFDMPRRRDVVDSHLQICSMYMCNC